MKKTIVMLITLFLCITPLYGGPTTIITLSDNSSYEIHFDGIVDTTWTYSVTELFGLPLSHWSLGIECLLDNIVSSTPAGIIGVDGQTGFNGIKWDSPFSSISFAITLDDYYDTGEVNVMVKGGNDFAIGMIDGPVCRQIPAPSALLLGVIGMGFLGYFRQRKSLQ
jgi:hypothetical protein